jgi:hypothetical protein
VFIQSDCRPKKLRGKGDTFGLRWQIAATTARFECRQNFQSGVALRLPPQSKISLIANTPGALRQPRHNFPIRQPGQQLRNGLGLTGQDEIRRDFSQRLEHKPAQVGPGMR